jgi:hypothetical protein
VITIQFSSITSSMMILKATSFLEGHGYDM